MWHFKKTTKTVLMGALAGVLFTQLPGRSQVDPYCRKVNYPVGLIVRFAPTSSSRRIGAIAYGETVKIDGTLKRVGNIVIPATAQDSQGTTWVKIKAPLRGFVLFTTGSDRDSLISCESSLR